VPVPLHRKGREVRAKEHSACDSAADDESKALSFSSKIERRALEEPVDDMLAAVEARQSVRVIVLLRSLRDFVSFVSFVVNVQHTRFRDRCTSAARNAKSAQGNERERRSLEHDRASQSRVAATTACLQRVDEEPRRTRSRCMKLQGRRKPASEARWWSRA
jgi:hypothetical protein